jgi:hypothetical protein
VEIGLIDFQGLWKDSLLKGKHSGDIEIGFSRHDGSIPLMCFLGASEDVSARPLVHHQDEPARLSLGVVASQQWGTRPVVWTVRKGTVVYPEIVSAVGS